MSSLSDYREAFRSNPNAFVKGARRFCKEAASSGMFGGGRGRGRDDDDDRDLFDRVLPWLIGLPAGFLALRGASQWGRYAERTGSPYGPIMGPLKTLALMASHPGHDIHWDRSPGSAPVPVFTPRS